MKKPCSPGAEKRTPGLHSRQSALPLSFDQPRFALIDFAVSIWLEAPSFLNHISSCLLRASPTRTKVFIHSFRNHTPLYAYCCLPVLGTFERRFNYLAVQSSPVQSSAPCCREPRNPIRATKKKKKSRFIVSHRFLVSFHQLTNHVPLIPKP